MVVPQKVESFRTFAQQLAAQVVEQLCSEFEREVAALYDDVLMYRNELTRVAELLGHQTHRERQLHDMMERMTDHHAAHFGQASQLAQNTPHGGNVHDVVDQLVTTHNSILQSTLQGVSQAAGVVLAAREQAKQMHEPLITAENEYARIMQLLQTPVVPGPPPNVGALLVSPQPVPWARSASPLPGGPGFRTPPASGALTPQSGAPTFSIAATQPAVPTYGQASPSGRLTVMPGTIQGQAYPTYPYAVR